MTGQNEEKHREREREKVKKKVSRDGYEVKMDRVKGKENKDGCKKSRHKERQCQSVQTIGYEKQIEYNIVL